MNELKPCPFCGHSDFQYAGIPQMRNWPSKLCRVMCRCGVEGPNATTHDHAIAAWNTRTPQADKEEK